MKKKYNTNDIDKVYHFTSIKSLYDMVQSSSIRMTDSRYLNDRQEAIDFYKIMQEVTHNYKESGKKISCDEGFENLVEKLSMIIEKTNDEYSRSYVFSTCSDKALLPMWSLYAKDSGVCVEFDKVKLDDFLENACNENLDRLPYGNSNLNNYKCLYGNGSKREHIKEIVEFIFRHDLVTVNDNKFILGIIKENAHIFKNELFSYEDEIRYVITAKIDDKIHIKSSDKGISSYFYPTNNTIRPCISIRSESKLPINKITISPFNLNETTIVGINEFMKYHDYDVEVDVMKTSARFNNH